MSEDTGKEQLIEAPFSLTSSCWNHFKMTRDKKKVVCNICHAQLKYFNSTTNLFRHMARAHASIEIAEKRIRTVPRGRYSTAKYTVCFARSTSVEFPEGQKYNREVAEFHHH